MSIGAKTDASSEAILQFNPTDHLSLRGSSVLIVDEDPAFQLGLKTFLKEYVGFSQTFTAKNGREALERLIEEPSIAMVTLDYKMPEMDGLEFLAKLKEQIPRPIGVIMITGYPSDELEETFRSYDSDHLRAVEFMSKPVEFTELETIIHRSWEDLQKAKTLAAAEEAQPIESARPRVMPIPARSNIFPGISESAEKSVTQDEQLTVTHDTTTIMPIGFRDLMEAQLEIIGKKVNKIEAQVDKVERRVPSRFGRFFMGIVKILLALVLFWAAAQLGWIDKASDFLKSTSLPALSSDPESSGETVAKPEILPDASIPEPTATPVPAVESTEEIETPLIEETVEEVPQEATAPLRVLPERLGDDGEL